MAKRPKGRGERNPDRKNGKAWKKRKRSNKSTGKTIGGYKPAKIAERERKRANVDSDNITA